MFPAARDSTRPLGTLVNPLFSRDIFPQRPQTVCLWIVCSSAAAVRLSGVPCLDRKPRMRPSPCPEVSLQFLCTLRPRGSAYRTKRVALGQYASKARNISQPGGYIGEAIVSRIESSEVAKSADGLWQLETIAADIKDGQPPCMCNLFA